MFGWVNFSLVLLVEVWFGPAWCDLVDFDLVGSIHWQTNKIKSYLFLFNLICEYKQTVRQTKNKKRERLVYRVATQLKMDGKIPFSRQDYLWRMAQWPSSRTLVAKSIWSLEQEEFTSPQFSPDWKLYYAKSYIFHCFRTGVVSLCGDVN